MTLLSVSSCSSVDRVPARSVHFSHFIAELKIRHLYSFIAHVYMYNNVRVQEFFVPLVKQLIYSSIVCALFNMIKLNFRAIFSALQV